MQKIEQKQLQKLREQQKKKEQAQNNALRNIIEDDSVQIVLKYCKQILSQSFTQNLSDYSPTYLSKFIFDEQLQKAKKQFQLLPNGQCKIQHFLSLMIKALDFPFQKWPFYLVGLKDMFNQIKVQKRDTITYAMFFKYVIGEVLDFKQEQQNTQFQVRFQQLKKQDYLLHDTGINKFYYSNDQKLYITLDDNANVLKLYNKQMRMINKFIPNKQKHNKKFPSILWFDYSQLINKLGLLLSDSTLSIVNFYNFLSKPKSQFQLINSNQIVVNFEDKMLKIFYIQMLNRWVLISQYNKFYLFDLQKYRQQDPQYLVQIKMENPDLSIRQILQLVNLSVICVVMGNEILFYNQNFTQKVFTKFVHGSNIKTLRYNQDTNTFYISGQQKTITLLTIHRSGNNFHLSTFQTQSKTNICTFDIFPILGTIVVVDQNNQVRLYDEAQKTCYQLQNYSNIVKNQQNKIKILKTSKNQFALYQTYTLIFEQQKIAIQKDVQYEFLYDTYYDKNKEQFYFSVNNQIISFSVAHGQIRKSYNQNTANIPKHQTFNKGKNNNLFIIDYDKNIYEAYLKDAAIQGQNRNYKKKLGISSVIRSFLDEEVNYTFVVGDKAIYTIRNDGNNTFAVNSVLNLQYFPTIINAKYNSIKKQIQLFSKDHQYFIINAQNYKLLKAYSYIFPKDPNQHQDKLIIDYDYDQQLNIDILLTNQNQIYIIACNQNSKQIYIKIQDYVPYKLRLLKYTNLKYFAKKLQNQKNYLLIWDTTGYLTQFDLTKLLSLIGFKKQQQLGLFKHPVKQTYNLRYQKVQLQNIYLKNIKCDKLDKKKILIIKAHQKQIKITNKINIQGIHTLTFSIDGNIKLWNKDKCLFNLKLPDLKKHIWQMNEIQKIKNNRSIGQIMKILTKIQTCMKERATPQKLIKKNQKKQININKDLKKVNIQQPIPLQIQNKDIQDIINKTQNINWYSFSGDIKKKQPIQMSKTARVNPHPWRIKNNFIKIFQKASPINKYSKKMPHDLIYLRTSLDMKDRKQFQKQDRKQQLFILPQLNAYQPQKYYNKTKKQVENQQQQEQQILESCLYVKKGKHKRKINELDQIDKQFKKKWIALSQKKWIPTRKDRKKQRNQQKTKIKIKAQILNIPTKQTKYDPIKQIKGIFQNHNRQAMAKKERLIRIPNINLKKEQLFS